MGRVARPILAIPVMGGSGCAHPCYSRSQATSHCTMLRTPDEFRPLTIPPEHSDPQTFVFRGGELLVHEADLTLPAHPAIALPHWPEPVMHPVGLFGERFYQTTWVEANVQPAPGYAFIGLRALFGALDDRLLGVAARALQIVEWARTHRFCGACGTRTEHVAGEHCMRCPACGHVAYPRISPAMMVLIRRGDHVLLARHAGARAVRYSPLAGFLEPGESIEEAVHREVLEEVGLKVKDLKYFGSQSWPFPHSLMIAFTAEYAGGEIRVQEDEIVEARWFGPNDDMPPYAKGISISGALIEAHWPGRQSQTATAEQT